MRLQWGDEEQRFLAELRAWLDEHAPSAEVMDADPPRSTGHIPAWAKAWQQQLFDARWLIPGLGPELGGRNAGPVEQLLYFEEMTNRALPRSTNWQGLAIIIPSILEAGTPEQIERFAMPSLRAERSWCLGMSEPNAGSDLAGLQTKAVRDGDVFVVNGQKIWTSGAADADWCLMFVRTDTTVAKHKGISCLLIDMRTPGVEVRPIEELAGGEHHDLAEVFLSDVVVPADQLLGPLNGGWPLTQVSLGHERATLWIDNAHFTKQDVQTLIGLADHPGTDGRPLRDDPRFRDAVAQRWIDSTAIELMGYRGFAKFTQGKASPEHSVLKLFSSEAMQQTFLTGADFVGPAGLDQGPVGREARVWSASWPLSYLRSFSQTIPGGTSEIQRNIIAERVLGLPRR
jgi:alkylation response protein AidB-like acyl-CoA dehydrogenase